MNTDSNHGIGTDILEVGRMRKALEEHGLRMQKRLFTPKEIAYCSKFKDPVLHFAGRFCAKEAVAKALGTGFGKMLSWHDIEIGHEPSGKPIAILSAQAKAKHKNPKILLSISHCKEYAIATAIIF